MNSYWNGRGKYQELIIGLNTPKLQRALYAYHDLHANNLYGCANEFHKAFDINPFEYRKVKHNLSGLTHVFTQEFYQLVEAKLDQIIIDEWLLVQENDHEKSHEL